MPAFVQLDQVDPVNPAELPLQADPGTKIVFLDVNDELFKERNDVGVDAILGAAGGDWTVSAVIDQGGSPHPAVVGQITRVNPTGLGGVEVALPQPGSVAPGARIAIKNVTDVENPDAPFGSDNIINITVTGGTIDGQVNSTMTTLREYSVFVSDGAGEWMQMG